MKAGNPLSLALVTCAAVATVSVALPAANMTWHALGHFPDLPQTSGATATAALTAVNLQSVLALAPFGVSTAIGPAQATSTNLVLRGVVVSRPASKSTALISASGAPPKSINIGEALPGGATLESVAADHVVLAVAGRREILRFPDGFTTDVSALGTRGPDTGIGSASPTTTGKSPGTIVDQYRQKITDNPQTLLDELNLTASPDGYRVGDRIAPALRRSGLQPGDLVVRINGVPVGDAERDREHFEDVIASGRARVEVMRGRRLLILSFSLR